MKLIIAGGRDFRLTAHHWDQLDALLKGDDPVCEVVSGCCSGVDASGEMWAMQRNVRIERFPADWQAHGKFAGPIRNRDMAQYADAVALFPGGRGTASMEAEAKRAGIKIFDFR